MLTLRLAVYTLRPMNVFDCRSASMRYPGLAIVSGGRIPSETIWMSADGSPPPGSLVLHVVNQLRSTPGAVAVFFDAGRKAFATLVAGEGDEHDMREPTAAEVAVINAC